MAYVMANDQDFYTQHDSTSRKLFDSSGNITANKLYGGTTSLQIASSAGILYQNNSEITASAAELNNTSHMTQVQIMTSGVGTSAAQITGYGVTVVNGDTGCSLQMGAPPYVGHIKTLIFNQGSSIARTIDSTNTTGSSGNDRGWSFFSVAATNSSGIVFSSASTKPFAIQFVAMTTKQWIPIGPSNSSGICNYSLATT
jgi:hypothetical protein